MTESFELEMVPGNDPAFDNRPYWTATQTIAGVPVSIRWVADGERFMTAQQFCLHASSVFNKLKRFTTQCTCSL